MKAILLTLALTSCAHAQYGLPALPVVPLLPGPVMSYYSPQGGYTVAPGYTSMQFSDGTGFSYYSPYAAQAAWSDRTYTQMPVYAPGGSYWNPARYQGNPQRWMPRR